MDALSAKRRRLGCRIALGRRLAEAKTQNLEPHPMAGLSFWE
jgi:hypothetical protein